MERNIVTGKAAKAESRKQEGGKGRDLRLLTADCLRPLPAASPCWN